MSAHSQCSQGAVATFQKVYGNTGNEQAHSVKQTADGGFIVVGETSSYGAGNVDWFAMKLDAGGNNQWTKVIGSSGVDDGWSISVEQTSDLGYLIVGQTTGFGSIARDPYLVKLSNAGTIQWESRITGNGHDYYRDVLETQAGEFMLIGTTNSYGAGNSDFFVVKFSAAGNLIWTKTYGGSITEHATSIIEISPNNFVICGSTETYGAGSDDGMLLSIDQNGVVNWTRSYGGTNRDIFESTLLLSDGNIVSVGYTQSYGTGPKSIYAVKTDVQGNVIWSKVYAGLAEDRAVNVQENSNAAILISAVTNSSGFGSDDHVILRINQSGNLLGMKAYGGASGDELAFWGEPLVVASNSSMMLVGSTTSFGMGGKDIYIIKTNSCSESFCHETNITFNESSPAVVVTPIVPQVGTGGTVVATNSVISSVTFPSTTLCIDTPVTACHLVANFTFMNTCLGNLASFTDLSTDSNATIVDWKWYFGDGNSAGGVQNTTHTYSNPGTYQVTLVVANDSNCVDSATFQLTVYPNYAVNDLQYLCQGDSVFLAGAYQFTAGIYADTLQTIHGCDSILLTEIIMKQHVEDSVIVEVCEGESVFLQNAYQTLPGVYQDQYQTGFGCDSILYTTLIVKPVPDIIAYPDTAIDPGTIVQLYATGGTSYLWSPPDGLSCTTCPNPIAAPLQTTAYLVTGYLDGCKGWDTVLVEINKLEITFYVPNAFTPDGNGVNDYFKFYATGYKSFEAMIFNRWGELLFETKDITQGWDGVYKGKMVPLGVYVYRAEVVSFDNEHYIKTGAINLIR
ncbi:MAG: gliding motility-associated C-terminal domain-containing protein [Flavobacteriales bacterium]|nr:gliding motility-associated C-terminal domain-containing protein [Flavobacteriales bacterium]